MCGLCSILLDTAALNCVTAIGTGRKEPWGGRHGSAGGGGRDRLRWLWALLTLSWIHHEGTAFVHSHLLLPFYITHFKWSALAQPVPAQTCWWCRFMTRTGVMHIRVSCQLWPMLPQGGFLLALCTVWPLPRPWGSGKTVHQRWLKRFDVCVTGTVVVLLIHGRTSLGKDDWWVGMTSRWFLSCCTSSWKRGQGWSHMWGSHSHRQNGVWGLPYCCGDRDSRTEPTLI